MKINILSDLHLEFGDMDLDPKDADLIILAGDICPIGKKGNKFKTWYNRQNITIPIIYVMGNHEYYFSSYPKALNKLKQETRDTNIHVLENDYYIYKDLVILGCTLWTDYKLFEPTVPQSLAMNECYKAMNDFNCIRNNNEGYRKLVPKDLLFAHYESVDFLKTYLEVFNNMNVGIVTHHSPTIKCIESIYHKDIVSAAYASNLDEFVAYSGAKFWISGHSHMSCDFMLGDTRVISNPGGYWPTQLNPNFIKDLVIEVK